MQSYDIVCKKGMCYFKLRGAEYTTTTTEEMKKPDHVSETKPQHHLLSLVYLKGKSFQPKAQTKTLFCTHLLFKNDQLMLPTYKKHGQGAPPML
jgi:hypothetical protein